MIRKLIRGPKALIDKINEIIVAVNNLGNIFGSDGIIQVKRGPAGTSLNINTKILEARIPKAGGGSSGTKLLRGLACMLQDATQNNIIKGSILSLSTGKVSRQATLDAALAVNKGGGKVGLPSTAHGFFANERVTISGTDYYDDTYVLEDETSVNELVITEQFRSELFSVTDTVTTAGEGYNVDIYARIDNSNRLDQAWPRLSEGSVYAVEQVMDDVNDVPTKRWYFRFTFGSTEDYHYLDA